MAGSNAVVHVVCPISLAENAQRIDAGLAMAGNREIPGIVYLDLGGVSMTVAYKDTDRCTDIILDFIA